MGGHLWPTGGGGDSVETSGGSLVKGWGYVDEFLPRVVVTAGVVVLKVFGDNVAFVTAVARVDVGEEAGFAIVDTLGGEGVPGGQSISSVESEQSKWPSHSFEVLKHSLKWRSLIVRISARDACTMVPNISVHLRRTWSSA